MVDTKLMIETTKKQFLIKPTTNIITNNIRNDEILATAAQATLMTPETRDIVY